MGPSAPAGPVSGPGTSSPGTSGGGKTGGGAPASPGVGGPGGVGMPEWARLSTAQRRLEANWEFARVDLEGKLDFAAAFEKIRNDDPRPIILLRDCSHSVKDLTKVATFTDDERVALGMNWFHLVRVEKTIIEATHPLHSLMSEGNPHMIIFSSDGKDRIDIGLMPTANELWSQMTKSLKKEYKRSPEDAVSKWRQLLTEFDKLDKESARLKGEDYRKNGSDEAIQQKLEDLDSKRQKLTSDEKKIKDLDPKNPLKKTADKKDDESWRDDLLKKKAKKPADH